VQSQSIRSILKRVSFV